MKQTTRYIFITALISSLVSCSKVIPDSLPLITNDDCICVEVEGMSPATKTTLSGLQTLWASGDTIKVFTTDGKSAMYAYQDTTDTDGEARFKLASSDEGYLLSNFAAAYYPGEKATAYNASTGAITATVPATQTYVAGSFGPAAAPMASNQISTAGTTTTITFANAFAVLKLKVYDSSEARTLTGVQVSAENVKLNGDFTFTLSGTNSIAVGQPASGGTKTTTLNAGSLSIGGTVTPTVLYIAIPAPTSEETLAIKSIFSSGYDKSSITVNKTVSSVTLNALERNDIFELPEKDFAEIPHYWENGIDCGPGIPINGVIWAPVNCGYDATHTYGLLYQWGRKYGQAYEVGTITATELTKAQGQLEANKNKFAKYNTTTHNWFTGTVDNTLWTDSSKGTYDPCPSGWRVPTVDQLGTLAYSDWNSSTRSGTNKNASFWDSDNSVGGVSQAGYWMSGSSSAAEGSGVFLPAPGWIKASGPTIENRGSWGKYWSSSVNGNNAYYLDFKSNETPATDPYYRCNARSIRCIHL